MSCHKHQSAIKDGRTDAFAKVHVFDVKRTLANIRQTFNAKHFSRIAIERSLWILFLSKLKTYYELLIANRVTLSQIYLCTRIIDMKPIIDFSAFTIFICRLLKKEQKIQEIWMIYCFYHFYIPTPFFFSNKIKTIVHENGSSD